MEKFEEANLHRWHVEDGRDQVVRERRVLYDPVGELDLFEKGKTETLGGAALDLALDRLGVDRLSHVWAVASSTTRTNPSSVSTSTTARCAA